MAKTPIIIPNIPILPIIPIVCEAKLTENNMTMTKKPATLQHKIKSFLEGEIKNGGFANGKLPSERTLAVQLNISRDTLRSALDQLEEKGHIVRYRNKGTFLKTNKELQITANKNLVLIFPSGFSSAPQLGSSGFYSEIYFSIVNESSNRKFSLVTYILENLGKEEMFEKCKNMKIDGFILISYFESDFVETLKKLKKPIAIIDHKVKESATSSINVNSYKGSYDAVKYLNKLGHTKIAYINHLRWKKLNLERAEGYFSGLKSCGIALNETYHQTCKPNSKDSGLVMEALLKLPTPPTAVLCFDEAFAIGAYRTCQTMNFSIPKDISLIAFGGFSSQRNNPIINTIDLVEKNIGKVVLDLLNQISHEKEYKDILLDVEITDNGSCSKIN